MTKKKPSPQNRIWEKERRERLNKTFDDLQRLLPDHQPASTFSKVEILQRAIEHITKLQKKIKTLVEDCTDPLKDHVKEQELRLKRLLVRNEELAELLRKAKITVPPFKYTTAEEEIQRQNEEKENGNRPKKAVPTQRRTRAVAKRQPVIGENQPPASVVPSTEAVGLSIIKSIPPPTSGAASSGVNSSGTAGYALSASGPPTLRNNHGSVSSNVNVTPALLPTPIMTTSVLISNNGNLVQVPIVAPPSSLLIVGNEDVRSKINLRGRARDGNATQHSKGKRGKFTIKSIDLIPGRIVNGKIPIPPLKRSTNDSSKKTKPRLKRKRLVERGKRLRKSSTSAAVKQDTSKAKRARLQQELGKSQHEGNGAENEVQDKQSESVLPAQQVESKIASKEQEKDAPQPSGNEPAPDTQLDISLNQPDLSEDIFANLHVGPDGANVHGDNEDGTLSPTAAYLMNFPLVAGGGKAAGNHADNGEAGEECGEVAPSETKPANEQTNLLLLDNFSSFFSYGHMDAMGSGAPAMGQDNITPLHTLPSLTGSAVAHATSSAATSSAVAITNYPTIYQSIDNMLDSRPVVPARPTMIGGTTNRALATEAEFPGSATFTFTLTSTTSTAPTTVQPSVGSGHFYAPACGALNAVKPAEDFSSPLKPSIEFTFSLTSSTASQPKTVQSQYTNSAILATTMTTPSYDTYGYFHKTVPKSSNYCGSFNVLDPLLATEKPATSFTFSLTSSTKTEPSYTQSTIVPTNTTQTYGTPPKLSTKPQQQHPATVNNLPAKQEPSTKLEKTRTVRDAPANPAPPVQQQQQLQSQQSKYDVSWMAAGVHQAHQPTPPSQNGQQQSHQSNYETIPSQIIPPIEFPPTVYAATNNYKSDIFFAHPPGEEHNLTWSSPSKLSNILNDSSSPYFPPVTLPSLNGDLALNTSGSGNQIAGTSVCTSANRIIAATVSGCKIGSKKAYTQSSTIGTGQGETTSTGSFLSVSQLVNEPSKSFSGNAALSGANSASLCQKSTNNNYSAEALIGNTYTHPSAVGLESGRKDKLFDYGASSLEAVPSTSAPLTFSFDTYGGNTSGVDYNKGYNFGSQQNSYMSSSYGESSYGGTGSCVGPNAYYGKTPSSQGYYNQPNLDSSFVELGAAPSTVTNYPNPGHSQVMGSSSTIGQDYTPYYLPTFGEKKQHGASSDHTASRSKKSHKTSSATVPSADYVFNTTVAATAATSIMSSGSASYNYGSIGTISNNSASTVTGHCASQSDPSTYPNYHHSRHHNYHYQQQPRLPAQHPTSSSASSSEVTRKTATVPTTTTSTASSSYSYNTQYLSSKTTQQSHYDISQQTAYPHSHCLNLPSCINPSPAVGYGNVQPTSQSSYGQGCSSHHYRQSSQSQHHQQQHNGTSSASNSSHTLPNSSSGTTTSGGTITNFNLSTICPEINEKTGRSRDGSGATRSGLVSGAARGSQSASVASIVPHW